MRRYLPVVLGLSFLAGCSNENMDFEASISKSPRPVPLIEVYAPLSGSIVPAHTPLVVEYEVVRSREGDYVEIRVDKEKPESVKGLRGRHLIAGLSPGPHVITITERSAAGRETGGLARIQVSAE